VRRYVVDKHLGGPQGLAIARQELARRGMGLILDFVPNHVAPDSPWILEHPEHFMQGSAADLESNPAAYMQIGEKFFARGKDPFFPPWSDVVQVNAFAPGFRQAVIKLLLGIAEQCDGIRCDMAMLLMNNVFAQTWAGRAGACAGNGVLAHRDQRGQERNIRASCLSPKLIGIWSGSCNSRASISVTTRGSMIAWNTISRRVFVSISVPISLPGEAVRFIENHDEPRAAAVFSPAKARAAAITMATIPGAKLFHEGQFEGRRIKVPTFLGRRPQEPIDTECQAFTRSCSQPSTLRFFATGYGHSARVWAGQTTRVIRSLRRGVGPGTMIDAWSS
jgi:hypothetical protein